MSQWDGMCATVMSMLAGVFGEPCVYQSMAGGSPNGPPVDITVICSTTMPQIVVVDRDGQSSDRILYLGVYVSDVSSPTRGDLYTLSGVSNAGTWVMHKLEKRNGARWLISVRLLTHDNLAGPGAIEVQP